MVKTKSENQDLFSFKINYNNPSAGTGLYNGNISQTFWKTANTDPGLKNYIYTYDALNRLRLATDNLGKLNETICYDKNGNITNLKRLGEIVGGGTVPNITNASHFGIMDNLTYTYDSGNKLQIVSDSANDTYGFKDDYVSSSPDTTTDYMYDANGNMITDTNKGITTAITYNHLNLPTQVTFATGNIQYVYDATGVKLEKKVVENSKSDVYTKYTGSYVYEKIGTGTDVLKFFSQPEGYVANNSGVFSYIYQYKDHLGNIRLSYGDNDNNGAVNSAEIIEENNYYPFGLKHKGYNNATVYGKGNAQGQKYKYNGKELQDELGLNFYDYGARNYDPALGRWMNMDPLAELARRYSPYTYANDNPVFFIDPDGMTTRPGGGSFGENNGAHEDPEYKRYSSTDASGSDRFDENNIFIAPSDRIKPSGDNGSMVYEQGSGTDYIAGGPGKGKGGKGKGGPEKGKKKEKYADWQKKGQKVIELADAWLMKHTYVQVGGSLKVGTYVDVGLKHTARATLGNYDERGYAWSNQEGVKDIHTNKFVVGGGMEGGAQYTYDTKKREHTGSIGYSIFSVESNGKSTFIGININLSGGIGIGGEGGFKIGVKF